MATPYMEKSRFRTIYSQNYITEICTYSRRKGLWERLASRGLDILTLPENVRPS